MNSIPQDPAVKELINELGIESYSPEEQEAILAALGKLITERIHLEALKLIPNEQHDEYTRLWQEGDLVQLREFLSPYIADLDRFIQEESAKEVARFKENMAA